MKPVIEPPLGHSPLRIACAQKVCRFLRYKLPENLFHGIAIVWNYGGYALFDAGHIYMIFVNPHLGEEPKFHYNGTRPFSFMRGYFFYFLQSFRYPQYSKP